MKIKSYCIVENCDGSPYVSVYPYNQAGFDAARIDFEKIAKQNGVEEDIEYNYMEYGFNPAKGDAIANVSNGESWDLLLIESN